MDSESCTRAFSQARVYLEQIRSRVAPAGVDTHGAGKRDYLVDAAKQIRLALERDVSEDYEEAFNHYKNGVDVLLNGVQVDPNKERREAVKRKITQYLKRAEEIFNCHLQRTLGDGNSPETGYSSLRFRPIRTLCTPLENLRRCKVVGIIDKVQIVEDPATGGTFILKSLPKSLVETRGRQTIIPHGIPFMAKLLCYSVSEDSIFLHLEHVKGGPLWSHLRSETGFQHNYASSSSHTSTPKLSSSVGHNEEKLTRENPQEADAMSHQNWSVCSDSHIGRVPTSVNHPLLRRTDRSLPQKQSPNHTHARAVTDCKGCLGPPSGLGGDTGRKDINAIYSLSGTTKPDFKSVPRGHNYLVKQQLTFRSCDSLITTDGNSHVTKEAATQQEPKLATGERFNHSVLQTLRGSNSPKTETQYGKGPRCTQQPASLPRQSPVRPRTPLQKQCRENQPEMPSLRRGSSEQEKVLDSKEHKSQLLPEQYGPPEHQTVPRHGAAAWDVNEDQVQSWAAELVLALEGLHQQGVLCQDLNPRNLLLDVDGHIRLTYFGQWSEVEPQYCSQALEDLYCAPEVGGISELTEACDWWSFGALLYELLSGMSLSQNHPSGIHPHTQIHLPEKLSQSASALLTELLQYDPKQRLGSGKDGVNRIKSHPFFSSIQWSKMAAY
nr:ribosomal protein S6 kinase-like 1 isoform X1 [Pogona vitticeps]XP_020649542.1 ribosomal protein S6 kinase-like 1 isoform X1 [Pogona vitticeps]XP_020649543.1 ribosomal protein S6 kinase-like 1 isoform X1 [Pogona vitticeps]XP_020649544.1 ribosomal protein S6 kinase-like 1 isoform X1 [Pogona vitticeps]XP_020649545.1 ribosomal protein S6 kinase-like 1 isoform X1 [Pogona vitticeps]